MNKKNDEKIENVFDIYILANNTEVIYFRGDMIYIYYSRDTF